MQRNMCQKDDFALTEIRPKALARSLDDDRGRHGPVNDLCIALFDRWCERRELIALA